MSELTIYDSQGKQYGDDGRSRANERIESLFFGGVKVYVETGSRTELIVFFRARESDAGRAEQYYAVYETRSTRDLFRNFASALRRRIEDDYGMTIDTASSDVEIFEALAREKNGRLPGDSFDRDLVDRLLNQGRRLRFGVSSSEAAIGLLNKYLDGSARSIAIAEDTNIDELDGCDLSIEIDRKHRGLEPLGETSQLMDEARTQQQGKLLQSKIQSIKGDIDEIRRQTDVGDARIRNELKRELSVLESPASGTSRRSRSGTSSRLSSRQKKLGIAGAGILGVVVLAVLALNAAAFFGSGLPAAAPLVFVGGDDLPATNVTIDGEPLESEVFSNESKQFTIQGEKVNVSGETDHENVSIKFTHESGDVKSNKTTVNESTGQFDVSLDDLQDGDGNLSITVGADLQNESAWRTVNVTVDPVDDSESDDESSDEGGDGNDSGNDSEENSEPEPTLESLAINDEQLEEDMTVDAESITVAGKTNQDRVLVEFDPESGDARTNEASVDGATDQFEVALADLPEGNGSLTITAGADPQNGSAERTVNVTVAPADGSESGDGESNSSTDPEPSLENLAVNGVTLEENMTVDAGTIAVTGETNREQVALEYEWNETKESGWVTVEEGSFNVTLEEVPASEGRLSVQVKNESDEESVESETTGIEVREE